MIKLPFLPSTRHLWLFFPALLVTAVLSGCQAVLAAPQPTLPPPPPPAAPIPIPPTPWVMPTLLPSLTPGPLPSPTQPPPPQFTPTITTTPAVMGVFGFPAGVNPLTGLTVEDLTRLERRPVMVKISNAPPSVRPQAGLSFADLVFEYYIGEGANRFLAVFYGQDADRAGSLRSGRLIDGQLVSMYQGLLAYGSADPQVDEVLEETLGDRAISNLEANCPTFCGRDTHSSPWIYANTASLSNYANKHGISNTRPPLNGMIFQSETPESTGTGQKIAVEYSASRGEWRYNPESGLYERWEERRLNPDDLIPLTDQLNDQPLAFANVIVLFAEYTEFAPTLHDVDIWGNQLGRKALFFRDGILVEGSWRTVDRGQPIQFFNQYGLPMILKPGTSWIHIVGLNTDLSQPEPGHWELRFHLP